MNRRFCLLDCGLLGLAFLAGLYARPNEQPVAVAVNRPVDIVEVASGPGCTPDHFPDFADCRIMVREWDRNGNVSLEFSINPDDPASRIFE